MKIYLCRRLSTGKLDITSRKIIFYGTALTEQKDNFSVGVVTTKELLFFCRSHPDRIIVLHHSRASIYNSQK
jgi:hypothetical protein